MEKPILPRAGSRALRVMEVSAPITRPSTCLLYKSVLNDVLQLFVIVGGTVGITFQIAWAIFKEIHNNKK